MISRLLTKSSLFSLKVNKIGLFRNFQTSTYPFEGGCIIKAQYDGKDIHGNEKDLFSAIPQNLHGKDCVFILVDPTAISSPDRENKHNILTEVTHIAACILKPFCDKIEINNKTILSKIRDGKIPADAKDANIEGSILKKQNYVVASSFHKPESFYRYIFNKFKNSYPDRFYVVIDINIFCKTPKEFINKIESKVEIIKKEKVPYNRLESACPHPILDIYGEIDSKKFTGIAPQRAAKEIIEALLRSNQEVLNKFFDANIESGLSIKAVELGEILEKNLSAKLNTAISSKFNNPI